MSSKAPGTFVWNELMSSDPKKARAFYAELLGWQYEEMDMGPMGVYALVKAAGEQVGGIMGLEPGSKESSHWLSYVGVEDVDASAKRVPKLGGKVLVEPMDIPNIGRFALVQDPTGASFALYKNAH